MIRKSSRGWSAKRSGHRSRVGEVLRRARLVLFAGMYLPFLLFYPTLVLDRARLAFVGLGLHLKCVFFA